MSTVRPWLGAAVGLLFLSGLGATRLRAQAGDAFELLILVDLSLSVRSPQALTNAMDLVQRVNDKVHAGGEEGRSTYRVEVFADRVVDFVLRSREPAELAQLAAELRRRHGNAMQKVSTCRQGGSVPLSVPGPAVLGGKPLDTCRSTFSEVFHRINRFAAKPDALQRRRLVWLFSDGEHSPGPGRSTAEPFDLLNPATEIDLVLVYSGDSPDNWKSRWEKVESPTTMSTFEKSGASDRAGDQRHLVEELVGNMLSGRALRIREASSLRVADGPNAGALRIRFSVEAEEGLRSPRLRAWHDAPGKLSAICGDRGKSKCQYDEFRPEASLRVRTYDLNLQEGSETVHLRMTLSNRRTDRHWAPWVSVKVADCPPAGRWTFVELERQRGLRFGGPGGRTPFAVDLRAIHADPANVKLASEATVKAFLIPHEAHDLHCWNGEYPGAEEITEKTPATIRGRARLTCMPTDEDRKSIWPKPRFYGFPIEFRRMDQTLPVVVERDGKWVRVATQVNLRGTDDSGVRFAESLGPTAFLFIIHPLGFLLLAGKLRWNQRQGKQTVIDATPSWALTLLLLSGCAGWLALDKWQVVELLRLPAFQRDDRFYDLLVYYVVALAVAGFLFLYVKPEQGVWRGVGVGLFIYAAGILFAHRHTLVAALLIALGVIFAHGLFHVFQKRLIGVSAGGSPTPPA